MSCGSPVTYFLYNRPEKTKRSFEAIRRARPTRLFIVADGPKDEIDKSKVEQAREVVKNIDWDCEVTRIYSKINLGCGLRFSSGLNEVFSIVDRTIILEDDIVASDAFFIFQEQMLEKYKDEERVMMVTGWNSFVEYPIEGYDGFFSKSSAIWGWGTWRRAWSHYKFDPLENGEVDAIRIRKQLEAYMDDTFWVEYHLQGMNARIWSKLDTWDYQWALTVYSQHGVSVTPVRNLCLNIGFDAEATNYKSTETAIFMPSRLAEVSISPISNVLEIDTPATNWYDRANLLLYLLIMQKDLRILYLFHKYPQMLPDGPERKGWELYLGVFKYPKMCIDILDLLEKNLGHSKLEPIREVFKRI